MRWFPHRGIVKLKSYEDENLLVGETMGRISMETAASIQYSMGSHARMVLINIKQFYTFGYFRRATYNNI